MTRSQIDTILQPLQTVQERNLHLDITDKVIWLRTCYEPGADSEHERLLSSLCYDIEEATEGDGDECLLDDQTLYDYGDDWTRIFRRLPELVKGDHRSFDDHKQAIRDAQVKAIREFENNRDEDIKEPSYNIVHIMCQTNHLFIEDAEALRTGSLLVVWLDDCGRVVRQGRCPADELQDLSALQTKGAVYDCFQPWMTGEIGEAYRDGRLPYSLDLPVLPTFLGLEVRVQD